jgi:penicillin-binding protein 1A
VLGGLENGVSPLEMANAYATIASGGWRNRPKAITRVTFPDGKVSNWGKPARHKAFSDGVTYEATKILKANMTGGTGTGAQIGCPAAGKTGTTDDNVDAWFVGYTPNLSTAVWVGYPGPERRIPMEPPTTPISVAGGTYPATIWGKYMKVAKKGCRDFRQPQQAFQSKSFSGKYQQIEPEAKEDQGGEQKQGDEKTGDEKTGDEKKERQGTTETPAPNGGAAPEAPSQPEQQEPQTQQPAPDAPEQGGAGFDPAEYESPG